MAIKVIDSRRFNIVPQVSNVPTQKEVVMSKVNAIVVKQVSISPKQEVKAVQKMYTLEEVKVIAAREYNRGLSEKEVPAPTKHKVMPKQIIKVQAETQEVKPKADMHAAGIKAYATRIVNQNGEVFKRIARTEQAGHLFHITMDQGLPTEKVLRVKMDTKSGKVAQFRAKVEKKGKAPWYAPITLSF